MFKPDFSSLPNDIIVVLYSFLLPNLSTLAISCRRLWQISLPIRFRTVTLHDDWKLESFSTFSEQLISYVRRFEWIPHDPYSQNIETHELSIRTIFRMQQNLTSINITILVAGKLFKKIQNQNHFQRLSEITITDDEGFWNVDSTDLKSENDLSCDYNFNKQLIFAKTLVAAHFENCSTSFSEFLPPKNIKIIGNEIIETPPNLKIINIISIHHWTILCLAKEFSNLNSSRLKIHVQFHFGMLAVETWAVFLTVLKNLVPAFTTIAISSVEWRDLLRDHQTIKILKFFRDVLNIRFTFVDCDSGPGMKTCLDLAMPIRFYDFWICSEFCDPVDLAELWLEGLNSFPSLRIVFDNFA
ncbi:hypothetical protein HK096_003194, partial [Nowakowskiella sp. JEL0078]